jgi:Protein of unknown function (DUF1153)
VNVSFWTARKSQRLLLRRIKRVSLVSFHSKGVPCAEMVGKISAGACTVMSEERHGRVTYVIGPDGSPLTIADLPPPGTKRWVIRRKAEVVAAVRGGLLSLEEACARYTLTVEEFLAWQRAIDKYGLAGLRTTRVQQYRN